MPPADPTDMAAVVAELRRLHAAWQKECAGRHNSAEIMDAWDAMVTKAVDALPRLLVEREALLKVADAARRIERSAHHRVIDRGAFDELRSALRATTPKEPPHG